MTTIGCFSNLLTRQKKKFRGSPGEIDRKVNSKENHRIKPEIIYPSKNLEESRSHPNSHPTNAEVAAGNEKNKDLVEIEMRMEAANEAAGDEHDGTLKRDFYGFDLQALPAQKSDLNLHGPASVCGTPTLKRSCSNIETKGRRKLLCPPKRSLSYRDPQTFAGISRTGTLDGDPGTPVSVMSSHSADRVMLKKKSSTQVLPSRSRKLWWKLFLWSHRNLHKPLTSNLQRLISGKLTSNQQSGYCSDTLETGPGGDMKMKRAVEEPEMGSRTGLRPEYQWIAFSAGSSSFARVDAWVHSLEDVSLQDSKNSDCEETPAGAVPRSSYAEVGESSGKNDRTGKIVKEDVMQANSVVETMSVLSTVAHIASMGLKVIPTMSAYTSLRRLNLSGNLIDHISPGSLPKNLHALDLSRNKITAIEGLRELTRLRILDLSYNKISRIGHGLSNCTIIKELYLAGNKISEVEGLHRLPKLTVLDLSFNKIATAKALGQIVANYNSLLAINLVGNPVQTSIGEDQLCRAVSSLLPQLAYLNKQSVKHQRARELRIDNVAKAAVGDGSWSTRRKMTSRHLSHSSSSSSKNKTRDSSLKSRTREGSSSSKMRIKEVLH